MLKTIRALLLKIVDDIDAGNTNIEEEEGLRIIGLLKELARTDAPMSKYQAYTYLNISRATFDNMVREGKLPKGKKVAGFTFTNKDSREAVVVIGPTSSGKEFINTLCHEVYHVAVAIAEGLGVSLSGENPAYITGESMMELAQIVCKLGCQECN